eukprot:PhF_6_TR29346/c0_g1_i1/m.43107
MELSSPRRNPNQSSSSPRSESPLIPCAAAKVYDHHRSCSEHAHSPNRRRGLSPPPPENIPAFEDVVRTHRCSSGDIRAVVGIPGSRTVLCGDRYGSITQRDAASGLPLHNSPILMCESVVLSMLIATDMSLWVGVSSGKLYVFNLESYEKELEIVVHKGGVQAIVEDTSRRRIVTCGADWKIALIDGVKRTTVKVLAGHANSVKCLCVQGDVLYSGSDDRTARSWRFDDSTPDQVGAVNLYKGHSKSVVSVVGVRDRLWTASEDWTVRVWDTTDRVCVRVIDSHTGPITHLYYVGGILWSCGNDGNVVLYDIAKEVQVRVMSVKESETYGVPQGASTPPTAPRNTTKSVSLSPNHPTTPLHRPSSSSTSKNANTVHMCVGAPIVNMSSCVVWNVTNDAIHVFHQGASETESAKLRKYVEALRMDLSDRTAECAVLGSEIQSLRKEMSIRENEGFLVVEQQALAQNRDRAAQQALEEELTILRGRFEDTQRSYAVESDAMRREVAELMQRLQFETTRAHDTNSSLSQLNVQHQKLLAERDSLKEQLDTVTDTLAEFVHQAEIHMAGAAGGDNANSQIVEGTISHTSPYRSPRRNIPVNLVSSPPRVRSEINEVSVLEARLAEMNEQLCTQQNQNVQLRAMVATLEKECENLKETVALHNQQSAIIMIEDGAEDHPAECQNCLAWRERVESLEDQIRVMHNQQQQQQQNKSVSPPRLSEIIVQHTDGRSVAIPQQELMLQDQLSDTQDMVSTLTQENKLLRDECVTLRHQIERATSEIVKSSSPGGINQDEALQLRYLEKTVEDLTIKLRETKGVLQVYEQQAREYNDVCHMLETECNDLRRKANPQECGRCNGLLEELSRTRQQCEALQSAYTAMMESGKRDDSTRCMIDCLELQLYTEMVRNAITEEWREGYDDIIREVYELQLASKSQAEHMLDSVLDQLHTRERMYMSKRDEALELAYTVKELNYKVSNHDEALETARFLKENAAADAAKVASLESSNEQLNIALQIATAQNETLRSELKILEARREEESVRGEYNRKLSLHHIQKVQDEAQFEVAAMRAIMEQKEQQNEAQLTANALQAEKLRMALQHMEKFMSTLIEDMNEKLSEGLKHGAVCADTVVQALLQTNHELQNDVRELTRVETRLRTEIEALKEARIHDTAPLEERIRILMEQNEHLATQVEVEQQARRTTAEFHKQCLEDLQAEHELALRKVTAEAHALKVKAEYNALDPMLDHQLDSIERNYKERLQQLSDIHEKDVHTIEMLRATLVQKEISLQAQIQHLEDSLVINNSRYTQELSKARAEVDDMTARYHEVSLLRPGTLEITTTTTDTHTQEHFAAKSEAMHSMVHSQFTSLKGDTTSESELLKLAESELATLRTIVGELQGAALSSRKLELERERDQREIIRLQHMNNVLQRELNESNASLKKAHEELANTITITPLESEVKRELERERSHRIALQQELIAQQNALQQALHEAHGQMEKMAERIRSQHDREAELISQQHRLFLDAPSSIQNQDDLLLGGGGIGGDDLAKLRKQCAARVIKTPIGGTATKTNQNNNLSPPQPGGGGKQSQSQQSSGAPKATTQTTPSTNAVGSDDFVHSAKMRLLQLERLAESTVSPLRKQQILNEISEVHLSALKGMRMSTSAVLSEGSSRTPTPTEGGVGGGKSQQQQSAFQRAYGL